MTIRCGDTVKHCPSGETWLVAYADYATGYLAPCGWPDTLAKIEDCEIAERCTDEVHAKLVDELCRSSDRRGGYVRRLYRPDEEARMFREAIGRDCRDLAGRIRAMARAESDGRLRDKLGTVVVALHAFATEVCGVTP